MKTKLIFLMSLNFLVFVGGKAIGQEEKTLPPVTVTAKTNVSKEVTRSFAESFPQATNEHWYKMSKRYLVDFMENDQKNKALFQKNGAIVYQLTYGHENDLPDDIRKLVKSNYVDFNITSAINVHQDNRNIWVINIEDSKKLILVRWEENAIEEVGNYDKSL